MKLLALDTATLTAGVAAGEDGRASAERRRVVTTHSEALLVLVDEVLAEAGFAARDLDGVVCGAGPGSFTGLRIGLATAKGLCFALGKPLALVSSLAALAARAPAGRPVCALIDAHKGEVYAGVFTVEDGRPSPLGDEQVLPPVRLSAQLQPLASEGGLLLVGDGVRKYPELLIPGATLLDDEGAPRPGDLLRLGFERLSRGEHDPLETAGPRYIRPSEAELVKQRLKNSAT